MTDLHSLSLLALAKGACLAPFSRRKADPASRDDCCRILMEDSRAAFFDYDARTDDLYLSVMLPNGCRRIRRYRAFLRLPGRLRGVPPELWPNLCAVARHYLNQPAKGSFSFLLDLFRSGEYRRYHCALHSLAGADGRVNRIVGRLKEGRREGAGDLPAQNLSIYRRAVGRSSLFVFEFDLPNFAPQPVGCEERRQQEFFTAEEYLDPNRAHLVHPDDREALHTLLNKEALRRALNEGRYELFLSLRIQNRRTQWIWVRLTLHISPGDGEREAHGIGYVQVIQEQKALEERAQTDCVTGLLNRQTTEERINRALDAQPEGHALFIFDIDHFKRVNDCGGHAEGDRLLRLVATALKSGVRQTDVLGRLGGDEFVALMCGVPDEAFARGRAEEFLQRVREIDAPCGEGAPLSISVGVAISPACGSTFAELYRAADCALYHAKGAGRNRACFAQAQPSLCCDSQ